MGRGAVSFSESAASDGHIIYHVHLETILVFESDSPTSIARTAPPLYSGRQVFLDADAEL